MSTHHFIVAPRSYIIVQYLLYCFSEITIGKGWALSKKEKGRFFDDSLFLSEELSRQGDKTNLKHHLRKGAPGLL